MDWRSVEGYPGVYEKPNAAGEVTYKVGWRDEEGKQRWKSTGTELADAVAFREQKTAERVPA